MGLAVFGGEWAWVADIQSADELFISLQDKDKTLISTPLQSKMVLFSLA